MKAVVQDRYGSPDVLQFADVPKPEPATDQVLVRVQAASLNARDWHVLRGDPYVARPSRDLGWFRPNDRIRGSDFAGVVESVGSAVTRFRPGDEVYGDSPAAFAEYVVAREGRVEQKPANLTFEEAAAVPLAGQTALIGVSGISERLLINGASGGVGTFAVQLAKAFGARVTAVCSTRNVELLESLGADQVIDYKTTDFVRSVEQHDVLLDLVGNRSLRDLRKAGQRVILSGGGVFTGGSVFGPMGLMIRGKLSRTEVLTVRPGAELLAQLRELIEAGKVKPVVDRTYPLAATADAMRYLEGEHARAKVVLTV
ncbi:NAD(P)-dependent alcohol dehydrogenase [Kribbella sp. NPDC026611]|uniref:NAD(P)-dependent alcohol dehydrogenase n=1 Tax=Kribbella sp. NPDC026611 TaxID=3154911 RepID=UPI00340008C0